MGSDTSRFVVITGLSGAGKTQALRQLEDLRYYCVDNIPVAIIPAFIDLLRAADVTRRRIAVCVDARTGEDLQQLPAYLETLAEQGIQPEVVFLDTSDEVIIHRYSESRRRHPCAPFGRIEEGIRRERELLEPIRGRADLLVDTSSTSVAELRERLAAKFHGPRPENELIITIMSFGFKFGLPPEADLVFDVRFLPNPYYDTELRPLSGLEQIVREYALDNPAGQQFLSKLKALLKFLIPQYAHEGKTYLTIAVGCTGGRHRSVAVAQSLMVFLRGMRRNVQVRHRDLLHSEGGG